MVPVPEEIVAEVKDWMAWNLNAPKVAENPDAVRQVVEEADPDLRSLILHTAAVTNDGGLTALVDAAEGTGMSPREVMGAVGDLHARIVAAGRPTPLIMARVDPRDLPEGRHDSLHRVLHMSEADAAFVVDL